MKCPFCDGAIKRDCANELNICVNCHSKQYDGDQWERPGMEELQSIKIAELEHERDKYKAALERIADTEGGSHEPSAEMAGCMTSEACDTCSDMINIAREALKGGE